MSSDPIDDNKNLPPWLRGAPLPPKPRGAEEGSVPPPPAPAGSSSEAGPDWLRSMSAERPAPAPAPELPPWLRDEADESPGGSADPDALPDWLRDIQGEPPSAGQPRAKPPEPGQASSLDWLSSAAGGAELPAASSSASGEDEVLPDWLLATPPAEPPRAPAELPSWLSDIASPDAAPPQSRAPETRAPGGDELPAWLSDITSSEAPPARPPAPETRAPGGDLPAWLSDITSPAEPERGASPAETRGPSGDDLPSWLRDITSSSGSPEPAESSAERPSWLSGLTPPAASSSPSDALWEQPEAASSPAEQPPSGDEAGSTSHTRDTAQIPAWQLGDFEPPSTGEPAAISPSGASDEQELGIPEWLRDASPEREPEIEPFTFEGAPSGEASAGEPTLPGWLTGGAEEAGSEPSLPSWMQQTGDASTSDAGDLGQRGAAETLPGWLQAAAAEEVERGGATAPEVPLWLQDLERDAASQPPVEDQPQPRDAEPAPAETEVDDLPAWLRAGEATPSAGETASPQNEPPAAQPPEDVPAWLRELRPAAPGPSSMPDEDIPEWLRATPPDAESAAPEQVPAWLNETAQPEAAPSAPAPEDVDTQPGFGQPSEPAEEDELPAWLRTSAPGKPAAPAPQEMPPWLRDEVGQPAADAAPGDMGLPAWLRGVPVEPPTPSQPPALAQPPMSLDWLNDEAGSATPSVPSAEAGGLVGGIELPPWLRPTEPEPAKEEISPADARSLDWLTRLGGQEEEEITAPAAPGPRLSPPKLPPRTPAQAEALALLQRLAAAPLPDTAAAPAEVAPSLWRRIGAERVLYLIMLAAIVIALIVPAPGWLGLAAPPTAPGAQALFDQIDRLGANDVVLVGYEWDARRSGELRPLEQAVMEHLIQRRVKLVLVSTDPQGSLLLFDLRDRLAAAGYNKRSGGEDYVLLGYKPGAELALRSLAQDFYGALRSDFRGDDATVGLLVNDIATGKPRVQKLSDLAMILVLGDEPSDVQGWMEQVHPSAQRADGSYVPFGFLLPAETAPIVQPYLTQPSVYHLAAKQGALAYQQLRGGNGLPAGQIAAQTTQQRLSTLAYIALFVVGAIIVGIAAAVARRRA